MTKIDGRKAEIINAGNWYNTYAGFAVRHGYPDAAYNVYDQGKDLRKEPKNGDYVTLLVSGEHESSGVTLWIVEASNGERHIIGEKGLRILDDVIGNVTVLKDELGLQREYREVKRKAEVGERIKTTDKSLIYDYSDRDVLTITDSDRWNDGIGVSAGQAALFHSEYVVLEPTDIVRIKDERFCAVKRQADVGERVVVVNEGRESSGGRYYCKGDFGNMTGFGISNGNIRVEFEDSASTCGNGNRAVSPDDYVVLEPLAKASSTEQSSQPTEQQAQIDGLTETVANLARRLSKAETQLRVAREDIILIEEGVSEDIRKLEEIVAELEHIQVPKEVCEPVISKPLTRDGIIEQAKADVAELIRIGDALEARLPWQTPFYSKLYCVEFAVNRKKRTVVALIRYGFGDKVTIQSRGIAKAAPDDCFNVYIGQAIALRRALGLDFPQEYVNAPQPTEVRVGDVVKYWDNRVSEVVQERTPQQGSACTGVDFANRRFEDECVEILDDSRDGRYGEVYSV
ncbi:hypothetical protein MH117_09805 [Paenibacillus sp. ACRRX]|uniref:hypothetical protein n=1 Tax=Paenibacillus sp. ACRRX TaxID=2918206 RepID=UPI001EF614BC|nr:hypothetical protein [Paenibacillus sp. ACRRX]MCG7407718.1 hypothetical protein [Paenibacillus sp. ACRRX]